MHIETVLPAPDAAGARASELLGLVELDQDYSRLNDSSKKYADCWATFTGYPTVAQWNLDEDKGPLFREAMRAMCLKAAVYEITNGNEDAAELLLSPAVDEMTHAILAQHNILTAMQIRLGVLFPHMTDLEEFGWESGDYTDQCYQAAGWGVPPERYWVGAAEVKRRLGQLDGEYCKAGVHGLGRSHDFTFAEFSDATPLVAA